MNLVLIRGGKDADAVEHPVAAIGPQHVKREADRRLAAAGYLQCHMKSLATRTPIPMRLQYFKMQVDYVAGMLSSLDPVPKDFTADLYWPPFPASPS